MNVVTKDINKWRDEAYNEYMRKQDIIDKTSEIHEFLNQNCKMLHSSLIDGSDWTSPGYIYLSFYNADIEVIIAHLCPVVWERFHTPWTMFVESSYCIELKNKVDKGITIFVNVQVTMDDEDSCKIIKVPEKILSDDELDAMRIQYTYKLNCAEPGDAR